MEIGKPTSNIPQARKAVRGKYQGIYDAVQKLKGDEWLPVEFPSQHDAYNFRVVASTRKSQPMEARLRGEMVYVRLRRAAKNGKKR